MTNINSLYTHIRKVKKFSRVISGLLIVLFAILPIVLFLSFTGWRSYEAIWDEVLWQSSLQNGSFWLLPGHVIFQDDTHLGGEDEALVATTVMVGIFLIPVTLAIALLYRIVAFFGKIAIFRNKPDETRSLALANNSLVWRVLPELRDEQGVPVSDEITAGLTGRSVVIQSSLSHEALPPIFFDSVRNNIARREGRRLLFAREDELVLDGATFEHFRIYAHASYHDRLVNVLTSDLLAVIVKELDQAEMIIERGTLTVIVDVKSLKTEKSLSLLLESIKRLRILLDKQTKTGGGTDQPRVISTNNTIWFLGLANVRNLWVQVIMWLTAGIFVGTAIASNGKATTGDLIMPLWIVGMFQLIGIHRLLKHRISIRRSKGIFTSDWGRKTIRFMGAMR